MVIWILAWYIDSYLHTILYPLLMVILHFDFIFRLRKLGKGK